MGLLLHVARQRKAESSFLKKKKQKNFLHIQARRFIGRA
jgi:hypothetical protein